LETQFATEIYVEEYDSIVVDYFARLYICPSL